MRASSRRVKFSLQQAVFRDITTPSDGMLSVVKYYNLAIRLVITVVMNGNEGYYGQLSCGLKLISLELISYGHIITKLCLYLYIAYLLSTVG